MIWGPGVEKNVRRPQDSAQKRSLLKILWHIFGSQGRKMPAWDSGLPAEELSPRLLQKGQDLPRWRPHHLPAVFDSKWLWFAEG